MGIKNDMVDLIRTFPLDVLLFKVLLKTTSIFSHSNLKPPFSIDRILMWNCQLHICMSSLHKKSKTHSHFSKNSQQTLK